jgi:outer membrane usher protein
MAARFPSPCPSRREPLRLGAVLAVLLVLAIPAGAAEVRLQLAVELNGAQVGQVIELVERDGALLVSEEDLAAAGLRLPEGAARDDAGLVRLDSLPGVAARVNERTQILSITAAPGALRPAELAVRPGAVPPPSPAMPGLTLNYDAFALNTNGRPTESALLASRLFGVFGTLTSSANVQSRGGLSTESVVRLDTAWTDVEPGSLRRMLVGDTVTGGLSWSRPVRLGGVQLATDFGLQPHFVSFPLPTVTGQAALPSSADLMINGIRQFTGQVPAGPFEFRQAPVVTGAGTLQVRLNDATGHQTETETSVYISPALLTPGLAAYSVELGAVRRDYGVRGEDYGPPAGAGTLRYGVTDWLTAETHVEAMGGLGLAGAGASVLVGTLGVLDAALAGSGGAQAGMLGSVGVQRQATPFSVGGSATLASGGWRDIAARTGAPQLRSAWRANAGLSLGRWGSFSAAYVAQRGRATAASQPASEGLGSSPSALYIAPTYSAVTATYSVVLADGFSLLATGFATTSGARSAGALVQVLVQFGGSTTGAAGVSWDRQTGLSGLAQLDRPARTPGEYGYQAFLQEGGSPRQSGTLAYRTGFGEISAGVDDAPGTIAGRAEARGAITLADGTLFASNWIDDSFAVVRSGDVPDVGVALENRPAGRTGDDGRLLVPGLHAWDRNSLSIDAANLPVDIDAPVTRMSVVPPERAGVLADFRLARIQSAVVVLVDAQGRFLPVGSAAEVNGHAGALVGYDGEAYLRDLLPRNEVVVHLSGGTQCRAVVPYVPKRDSIPRIGPVPCR